MKTIDTKPAEAESAISALFGRLLTGDTLPSGFRRLKRLVEDQDRRLEEYRLLQDLIMQANSGVSLSDILDRVYESFRPLIPFDRIGLALLEQNGSVVRARWGRSESTCIRMKPGYAATMQGSSLRRIIETGLPRILNDLEGHLRAHPNSASTALMIEEGMRSSLTCPLIGMGKPIGFLFFSSMTPGTYQKIHVEKFEQIALQISLIVEKGRLYEGLKRTNLRLRAENLEHKKTADKLRQSQNELELANQELAQLASRDGLTGVANRRTFDETLIREWYRSVRSGGLVSLILIDIDEFKLYNDSHGHLTGDDCLRCIAQTLKENVHRPSDLVSRFGGEEFAVLLPQTPLGPAYELAEKMRTAVEERRLRHGFSSRSEFVTITEGLATMQPRKDIDPSILVATADLALYEGKESGRNRIVVSQASVA
jgi:diguanylate cyclase (GGDEF)-like protein